jgi:uncharacterized protein YydD (DUF2326 family)
MFLKSLKIEQEDKVIRDIPFHKGLNLIIDETQTPSLQESGNNVGKTTVLKLIDFCFGGSGNNIYNDSEFRDRANLALENFLKNNVVITLTLKEDLAIDNSSEIVIKKNFLLRNEKIQEINGQYYNDSDFDKKLKQLIFHTSSEKPTFRQIISKNIRYEKNRLENTVRVLHATTTFEQYEALYFFWLGIDTDTASKKQKLQIAKSSEEAVLKRLKKETSISEITQALSIIDRDINELRNLKKNFNTNEDYEADLNSLSEIKGRINKLSTQIGRLNIRRDIILEAKEELQKEVLNIDTDQLKEIYSTAKSFIPKMHVEFKQMVEFHNKMLAEKLDFITKELPNIEQELAIANRNLRISIVEEDFISDKLNHAGAFEELERVIQDLNKKYEQKGKYEEQLRQWTNSTEKLEQIEADLQEINAGISSYDKELEKSIALFNKYFSKISQKLYGEQFILSQTKNERAYELKIGTIGGLGTGKKKGQIAAFDIAYIEFCDEKELPCVHFILHDQIENIHDNQLTLIAEVANETNIQFIVPVLRDKLPVDLDADAYKVLSLSQNDKLFRI